MLTALIFSLMPWTGPSLPTALSNAHQYRLTVRAGARQHVNLQADGVPRGWIASFCTRQLCSPSRYTLQLNQGGYGTVEFQVLRVDGSAPSHASVRIRANGVPVGRTLFLEQRAQ